MCTRVGWSQRNGVVAGLGKEDSLSFPKNGRRGGCPSIPNSKGDKDEL